MSVPTQLKKNKYKRIILKLSGEKLMQGQSFGINPEACHLMAQNIQKLQKAGFEIGIVLGGGNIFRGIQLESMGMSRALADQMGMLGTLMNGIALEASLAKIGCKSKLLTALDCPKVAESYTWRAALSALSDQIVVIFVGGTGNPYFTTDTAAALRASEIQADVLLKATKVDGIYSKDPLKYEGAIKYKTLTYSQMLAEKLDVMDATAVALCRTHHIPILVFDMEKLNLENISQVLFDPEFGSLVTDD